jgi:transcriptional regulator with XRE-family HTH domain
MNKDQISEILRGRLALLSQRSGLNLSQMAAGIGLDRSALSQMLSGQTLRLPRAETLMRIAQRHSVSLDWLLGLSEDEALSAALTPAFEIEQASADGDDPLLDRWHAEAAGTKIRYVPSNLPDLLRTEEVISFDARRMGSRLETEISETRTRVAYNRQPETDMEVVMPLQTLKQFANGEGIWAGLGSGIRKRQLQHMAKLTDELYPTFRLFLYDGEKNFSAPFTVFGPRRAAIYLGDAYLVLNAKDAVASLARRFDHLVRQAVVHAHEAPRFCNELIENHS